MDERRKVANLGPVGVWVWQGDITAAGTEDANAANNEGCSAPGVAGAILRAAGDEVEAEAVAQGPWPAWAAARPAPAGSPAAGSGRSCTPRPWPRAARPAPRPSAAPPRPRWVWPPPKAGQRALFALGTGVGGVPLAAAAMAAAAARPRRRARAGSDGGVRPLRPGGPGAVRGRPRAGAEGQGWILSWTTWRRGVAAGADRRLGRAGGRHSQRLHLPDRPGQRRDGPAPGTGAYAGLGRAAHAHGRGLSGRVWICGQPLAIPDYSRWEGRVPQIASDAFRVVLGVPLVSAWDGHRRPRPGLLRGGPGIS